MALVLADRIKETTTTTGTGTYTLAGAVTGFESFGSVGNGNTTYYCCTDGSDFEVGVGTYTSSGTTLARTTILQSSNSDNAVDWSAGTRDIFCTQPAEKAFFLDADGVGRTETLELAGGATYDPPGSSGTDTATDVAIALLSTQRIVLGHLGYIRTIVDAEWGAALQIGQSGTSAFVDTKIYGGATAVKLHYNSSEKLATTSGGINVTGEVAATSLDISGDVDVDGTLEADAITVNGTALAASATTDTTNASNIGSGTLPNARLDAQLQDVAGLAVTNGNFIVGDGSNFVAESGATARTSLGLGSSATADTGISNGNVPVFTSGVADDDFLRVNGTSIEGRSASEVASDIGAATTDDATALAIALG